MSLVLCILYFFTTGSYLLSVLWCLSSSSHLSFLLFMFLGVDSYSNIVGFMISISLYKFLSVYFFLCNESFLGNIFSSDFERLLFSVRIEKLSLVLSVFCYLTVEILRPSSIYSWILDRMFL